MTQRQASFACRYGVVILLGIAFGIALLVWEQLP